MYVIKFNDKYYWCGYNSISTCLRKAHIYASEKLAIKYAECYRREFNQRTEKMMGFERPKLTTIKVVKVELKEI